MPVAKWYTIVVRRNRWTYHFAQAGNVLCRDHLDTTTLEEEVAPVRTQHVYREQTGGEEES